MVVYSCLVTGLLGENRYLNQLEFTSLLRRSLQKRVVPLFGLENLRVWLRLKMAWIPLESNPDVMNKFLHNLGVPSKFSLVDVYGLDEDVLATIPRPVLSVILLFPWNEKYHEYAVIQEKGQEVSDKVYYLKQVVSNACGSIALIHSVGNNTDVIELADGHLKQFLEESADLTPEQRGEHLTLKADGIINAHKEVALEGQTQAPDENVPVNYHFVAFVHQDGHLYELDGRKAFPVNHGESSPDSLLEDAAKVCKQYMERDPENIQFTVVALTTTEV